MFKRVAVAMQEAIASKAASPKPEGSGERRARNNKGDATNPARGNDPPEQAARRLSKTCTPATESEFRDGGDGWCPLFTLHLNSGQNGRQGHQNPSGPGSFRLHGPFRHYRPMITQRPIWRGHLRLALVSCPVALYNARHDRATIHFNMINPDTGNRIKMVSQDAETGREVARRDTVKGFEVEKGHYLIVTPDELDSVKVESSSLMAVEKFVDAGSIDPIYYDSSYYLAPDGKGSEDVYAVLREAIRRTGMVALTRVVIAQRERTVALRPMDGGLVAHTMNEQRDLNPAEPLFETTDGVAVDPEMVALAVQLIKRQVAQYDPADLEDRYETRLRAMLDAKIKGEGAVTAGTPPAPDSNVVDLMAALRASLRGPGARPAAQAAPPAKRAKAASPPEDARKQPGLKLPIEGGRKTARAAVPAAEQATPEPRKRRKA